jgi:hypothetical protein
VFHQRFQLIQDVVSKPQIAPKVKARAEKKAPSAGGG